MNYILLLVILILLTYIIEICGYRNNILEMFGGGGALQSLYSNDGIQDQYLTGNYERNGYNPYEYWKDIIWNLPTRNLDKLIYYPFLYDEQIDRYSTLWPYW